MKPGARVDTDNYAKEAARDFVLWKGHREGEPSWEFPESGVTPGRPGWHIECSAMALRLLGESPIDIHAGGIDLIFPHHENEIAQSEGATGKPFSRFWVHVEYLIVDDKKMSKSLGNTYTIPDVVGRGYRPSAVRYLLLSAHYRKQLNFTWASLGYAEEALRRVTDFLARLNTITRDGSHPEVAARVACRREPTSRARREPSPTSPGVTRRGLRVDPRDELRDRRRRTERGRRAAHPRGLRRARLCARGVQPAASRG
jgi:cysteinyl-tRNA synthetase